MLTTKYRQLRRSTMEASSSPKNTVFRIKEHNGNYYPQVKKFGLWMYLYFDHESHLALFYFKGCASYGTNEAALSAIVDYYRPKVTRNTYYTTEDIQRCIDGEQV